MFGGERHTERRLVRRFVSLLSLQKLLIGQRRFVDAKLLADSLGSRGELSSLVEQS